MVALRGKTLPDDSPSSSFQKSAILGPAAIDGLLGTTASQFARASGLQKLMQKSWT